MARPLRIEFAGALYHVTSRGDGRESIYLDDDDRAEWLGVLAHVHERFNWTVHAYCLMGNHYHLLIETPDGNLAKGMRQLNGVYTQNFNRRHTRVGHVFQGRYKAILVQKETYLLELARYIVLNPVRARMVRSAGEWPWSNYRATAGESPTPGWLEIDWVLAAFARKKCKAQTMYVEFVAAAGNQPGPWDQLKNQIYLGSDKFVALVQGKIEKDRNISEVPKNQRRPVAPALSSYFEQNSDRDIAVVNAFHSGSYTMKAIADHLNLHYSTISRIVARTASPRVGKREI